jgi:hypothetical protein
MNTSPVRTTNLGLRVEYTACAKRIKGESENISGKVPENELRDAVTLAHTTLPIIEGRSF